MLRIPVSHEIHHLVLPVQDQDFIAGIPQRHIPSRPGQIFLHIGQTREGVFDLENLDIMQNSMLRKESGPLIGNHDHSAGWNHRILGEEKHPFPVTRHGGIPHFYTLERHRKPLGIVDLNPLPIRFQ
jgi:hypothetical protein